MMDDKRATATEQSTWEVNAVVPAAPGSAPPVAMMHSCARPRGRRTFGTVDGDASVLRMSTYLLLVTMMDDD
eukprot:358823-Chlamydomonas_euryale.AAC.2